MFGEDQPDLKTLEELISVIKQSRLDRIKSLKFVHRIPSEIFKYIHRFVHQRHSTALPLKSLDRRTCIQSKYRTAIDTTLVFPRLLLQSRLSRNNPPNPSHLIHRIIQLNPLLAHLEPQLLAIAEPYCHLGHLG